MHGNVWEWCGDNWHENYQGAPNDGSAWIDKLGDINVMRGGSWNYDPYYFRSAYRNRFARDYLISSFGFRCVASRTS
jgi:formylglycine-generating enzyme required for sulfatase activity